MIPTGPDTKPSFTEGFFEVAAAQNPKPQTVALIAADAEFSNNACDGARDNAKKDGFKIVYDRPIRRRTTDFSPIVRAIQAANPDVVAVCSYPLDSVGIVRAVNEIGFKPKMIGGAMVGLQATVIKNQLGPLLNGWINYETWVPSKQMMLRRHRGVPEEIPGARRRRGRRSARLLSRRPGAMPMCRCSARRSQATKSLNDDKLADYIAQDHVQDHHGRHQVRQERRMGEGPHAAGAVSRHQEAASSTVRAAWTTRPC